MNNKVKKSMFFMGILAALFCSLSEGYAQVIAAKGDSASKVGATTEGANKESEDASTETKRVAGKRKNKLIAGVESLGAKAKSYKETAESLQTDFAETYQATKNTVAAGESLYQDVAENEMVSSVTDQVSSSLSTKKQYDRAKEALEERANALKEEATAKNEANKQNLDTLQEMYASSEDASTRATLETSLEESQTTYDASNTLVTDEKAWSAYLESDAEYQKLQEQVADLEKQLKSDAKSTLKTLYKAGKQLFKKTDSERSEEYAKVVAENFLAKDEEETAENNERIMKVRRQTFYDDTKHAITVGANVRQSQDKTVKESDLYESNAQMADYEQTTVNLLIQMRIQDIQVLYDYTKVLLADLRAKTARAVLLMPAKLKNYDRDPSVFDFSNYVFTEDDIGSDQDKVDPMDKVLR